MLRRWVSRQSLFGLAVFLVLLIADLATKTLAERWGEGRLVAPTRNEDLVFSLSLTSSTLVLVGSIVASTALIAVALALFLRQRMSLLLVSVLAAGLVGNVVDRVALGGVRDWIPIGPTRWNIADFNQLIGLIALLTAVARTLTLTGPSGHADHQAEGG